MRNLLRSMIRFSWAMPLFGMRQMGNMLVGSGSTAKAFDSVADALQAELGPLNSSLNRQITQSSFNPSTAVAEVQASKPLMHIQGAEERTIVTTCCGSGTVRHGIDGRTYFIVHGQLDGFVDGAFDGVWSATVFTPQDLVNYPPQPPEPFDRPFKPGEEGWKPPLNFTKSRWTFDQGWLEAVGPSLSRVLIHSDGQTRFWYSVVAFVSGGGGSYERVRGQVTSIGSAHFAAPPQLSEGLSFELNTVHVLKIVRQS